MSSQAKDSYDEVVERLEAAEDKLLRVRKIALDGMLVRHMVYRGFCYSLLQKIVHTIEKEDSA